MPNVHHGNDTGIDDRGLCRLLDGDTLRTVLKGAEAEEMAGYKLERGTKGNSKSFMSPGFVTEILIYFFIGSTKKK